MATYIKKLQDQQQNDILPVTSGKAVVMSDNSTLEDTLNNIPVINDTSSSNASVYSSNKINSLIGDLSNLATANKTNLVSAMNEVFQDVDNGKSIIAAAITDKGVSTSSSDSFQAMADNIASIPAGGGVNGGLWHPMPEWQDISNPPLNTVSMLFSDRVLNNAFNVTTNTNVNYTVTVTGTNGDIAHTCNINGSNVPFGTLVSIASGTRCDITFAVNTGKTTSYGYTTFRVDVTSTNTVLTCKLAKHVSDYVWTYSSVLWYVANAEINNIDNLFRASVNGATAPDLQAFSTTSSKITSIGTYAFGYCYNLRYVYFEHPEVINNIGHGAFLSCSSLAGFVIPDNVLTNATYLTGIGAYAFYNCTSLGEITIPRGLTTIASFAFANCFALKKVTFLGNVTRFDAQAFGNCTSLQTFSMPSSVKTLLSGVLLGCFMLKSITNLENVTISETEVDWNTSTDYNLEAINATNIVFSRIQSYGTVYTVSKLHSLSFSSSSTFSSAASPQIDISYCSFSESELVNVFNRLPTVGADGSNSKTIKISGNPGTQNLKDNISEMQIARSKGWAVSTA